MEKSTQYLSKQNPKANTELEDRIKKLEKLIEELKEDNKRLRSTVVKQPLVIDFKKVFEIAGPICSMSFDEPTVQKIERAYYSGD